MKHELSKLGVNVVISNSCSCRNKSITYTYTLPIRVDPSIEEFIKSLGESSMSFHKHSMAKINNEDFSLIAINRLKQIKLIIKNNLAAHIIEEVENLLIDYIRKRTD